MKDIGNSSNFTEEEELFLLRNKQGKIVGIKDLKQANFQETMKDWKKTFTKTQSSINYHLGGGRFTRRSCLVVDCSGSRRDD